MSGFRVIRLVLLVVLLVVKAYYLGKHAGMMETWQSCDEIYGGRR